MPKRSKEETLITINRILDTASHQLLTIGYDKMSYTTLSEETGISRTGVSHHFPKKTDFLTALEGRFLKKVVELLVLDRSPADFEESWKTALQNKTFLAIFRLMFHHSIVQSEESDFSNRAFTLISNKVAHDLGENTERQFEWLIGITLLELQKQG